MMAQKVDVCAAVVSDLAFDARVWKEARSLHQAGYRVRLIGCAYELDAPRARVQDGINVYEVPLGSRTRVSLGLRAVTLLRIWLEILRTPARVYHAHNIHVGPPAWLAARVRRAKLVYDGHELYGEPVTFDADGNLVHPGFGSRAAARVSLLAERFMVRRADVVITTNRSRAVELDRRHRRPDIDVLGNVPALVETVEGIDPGFPKGGRILLYQGGIYARGRAFRETIEALRLLDDVHFVVLGFGRASDLDLVRHWAEEAGVGDRVTLLPPRPFDELVHTAAAADVGIVPLKPSSLNSYLGDTNKLFEYLMAGLPVVASDLPEIRAVVMSGEPTVGAVFDPTVPKSIAAAIEAVLDPPEQLAERRREARRLAVSRYNWAIEERRLLELYDRVTGVGGAARRTR